MPGFQVIKHAQAHRHVTASACQLHSWDDKGNPVPFTLNRLNLSALDVRIGENEEKQPSADCDVVPFTVVFYGLRVFCRKTAQLCVTRCEC